MSTTAKATLQIKDCRGEVLFSGITKSDRRWIADALMDTFAVDDAEYDEHEGCIRVECYGRDIDITELKEALGICCTELEYELIFKS